jgi:hypothetical protein
MQQNLLEKGWVAKLLSLLFLTGVRAGGRWVAVLNENKANSANQLELGLGKEEKR